MKKISIGNEDALLAIDVQPTFMSCGELAVRDGHLIVPVIRRLMDVFDKKRRYASKDWHPKGHVSFASSYVFTDTPVIAVADVRQWIETNAAYLSCNARFNVFELLQYLAVVGEQRLWPEHGVADTPTARLHPAFKESEFKAIINKGASPLADSYSAFRDNGGEATKLAALLHADDIKRCFFVGLAEDFCVGWSALDAVKMGFMAYVIEDATRPVDWNGSQAAIRKSFAERGVKVIQSTDIL
ncbi:isochorismatase family protein [Candidatus Falkowbacteria bacterium]|nr:isochorismatase family protein [Candidatus Falkowbacteria bacterium]